MEDRGGNNIDGKKNRGEFTVYKRDLRFMARIIVQEYNCVIFLKKIADMRSINSRAFIKH